MARGAEAAVAQGADIIDINMGCPVKKVTRTGAGSALLCDPARGAAMVEAIIARTGLTVTVKIRSGWDDDSRNYVELAKALGAAGASAIAMHARTRAQGYRGEANWDHIRDLVVNSPIPVIGNGDVWSAVDARRMTQETGCAGVMIGRGALGNPWIFEELTQNSTGPSLGSARWKMVERHFAAHLDFIGEELRAVRRFRPFFKWYSHGLRGSDDFCHKINRLDNLDEVLGEARAFFCGAEIEDCDRQRALYDTKKALG
jgi:nifR3 family TIM-barrel protein